MRIFIIKYLVKLSCFVLVLVCLSSCEKDVYGPQGQAGDTGNVGAKGDDYNGFYFDTVHIDSTAWKRIEVDEHFFSWYMPNLNADAIESSLVLINYTVGNSRIRLPFEDLNSHGRPFFFTYRLIPDSVIIERFGSNYPFLPSSASFEILIAE